MMMVFKMLAVHGPEPMSFTDKFYWRFLTSTDVVKLVCFFFYNCFSFKFSESDAVLNYSKGYWLKDSYDRTNYFCLEWYLIRNSIL